MKNKKGISLIVLIVTIIVIIILAVTVILTISKNNPIEIAKEARFKEDIRIFQDELALKISKNYVVLQGQNDSKIDAKTLEEMQDCISSFTEKYVGKLVVRNNELKFDDEKTNKEENKWLKDLGVNELTAAEKVYENPTKYYGKYITNYSTGNEQTKDAVEKWQIFHSDGTNIYLIADDYISYQYVPKGKNGSTVYSQGSYKLSLDNVSNDYTGSIDIIENSKAKKWINYVDCYPNSTNMNIKSAAYMLDTNVWSIYAGEKAEYAIGAPTLEMLMQSYNKKYGVDYKAKVTSDVGYEISKDGGENWEKEGTEMLDASDNLYVINSTEKAYSMWLASPSANYNLRMMLVYNNGDVRFFAWYYSYNPGIRPVICIKSNTTIREVEGGFEIY